MVTHLLNTASALAWATGGAARTALHMVQAQSILDGIVTPRHGAAC